MGTRKALVVGIDYYEHVQPLRGCVNDANSVKQVLERNADNSPNFPGLKLMTGSDSDHLVTRYDLKSSVQQLFEDNSDVALFYFAGHGFIEPTGGYICTSEVSSGDDGFSLAELMTLANSSPAKNKIIILDSCNSGIIGNNSLMKGLAEISEGVTLLTASTKNQNALETGGSGLFTSLLVDALNGGAASLDGQVTPGSAYAHIDQSLGSWDQRPVFKTNVMEFISLRQADPPIPSEMLRALTIHFPDPKYQFQLDPSYEPERNGMEDPSVPPPDPAHNKVFKTLQKYVSVNLVQPVGAPHMWHAAMQSKGCELTTLGKHYWRIVNKGKI